MNKVIYLFSISFFSLSLLFSDEGLSINQLQPNYHTKVIGGGIIGALESYYAYLDAQKNGKKLIVTVYEKGQSFTVPALSSVSGVSSNTAFNIVPSLTMDEILSVVPRGSEMVEKLAILFSEPGGIRIDDVVGVNESESAVRFKEAVAAYGSDERHADRTQTLLMMGKMSMELWQQLYDYADSDLKDILRQSNFNACRNPQSSTERQLHDGYRIDLIYGMPNAESHAKKMQATYEQLGYRDCKILSPNEVMAIDESLIDFCKEHSDGNVTEELRWRADTVALWRPGGCIDARVFLPKFYAYLEKLMGTYRNQFGEIKNCFSLQFNKEVVGVEFDNHSGLNIVGLKFSDGITEKVNNPDSNSQYIFCPGESVGTLNRLGFDEPAYAGFAGPSLMLNIPITLEQWEKYKNCNHCMEVHKVGIVLAWQARIKDGRVFIGVAGTKAFYGDLQPTKNEAFALNRHLVQLNMINDVLPEMVSLACGRDTRRKTLLFDDIAALENKGVLERWVGRRAVAYDGFPTLGSLFCKGHRVNNARCTTHLGSGGVSFAPIAVQISRQSMEEPENQFVQKVLGYADSRRFPERKITER